MNAAGWAGAVVPASAHRPEPELSGRERCAKRADSHGRHRQPGGTSQLSASGVRRKYNQKVFDILHPQHILDWNPNSRYQYESSIKSQKVYRITSHWRSARTQRVKGKGSKAKHPRRGFESTNHRLAREQLIMNNMHNAFYVLYK